MTLDRNKIGAEGAKYIGEGIARVKACRALNLGANNSIGAEGAKYIGEGHSQESKSLLRLNEISLSENKSKSLHIGDAGAKYISQVVKDSETLFYVTS